MAPKTVLVSGGTKGIGKSAVVQLLREGCNVATFSRTKNNCDTLRKELSTFPETQFLVLQGDVNNTKDLDRMVREVIAKFKTIDILINNAGFGYFAECDTADMERVQEMVQTNVLGVAQLTKRVVPHMKKQQSGLIINLVSISGRRAFPNGEFYSATKFALMGYSEGIRNELKEFGIKVCTLCPGMVKTDFFDAKELERRKKRWGGKIPPMLEVEDCSRIISLICSQSPGCDIQDVVLMPFG